MNKIWSNTVRALVISTFVIGCGQEEDQKSKVKEAVEEVVTQPFKTYEGAKQKLKEIEKQTLERIDKELR
jgi:5-carboxymethyl-2-hydroxymuconate isomerase